jgi:RNA polymerase sigma factor (sigma-70 family)
MYSDRTGTIFLTSLGEAKIRLASWRASEGEYSMNSDTASSATTSDRYAQALRLAQRLTRSMYSGWQPAQRDDLVQNAMHQLLQRFGREGWPDNPEAYLRRTIRNTAINMADRQARRLSDAAGIGASYEDVQPTLDAVLNEIRLTPSVLAAQNIAIERALGLLDDRDAELFRMKFLDNVPTRVIAQHLDLHADTVSRMAHRAKRRLADALAEHPHVLDELAHLVTR